MAYLRTAVVGHEHRVKGRVFVAMRLEPYTKKDGVETYLTVWRGVCTTCDEDYEVRTPMYGWEDSNSFSSKRCKTCVGEGRK